MRYGQFTITRFYLISRLPKTKMIGRLALRRGVTSTVLLAIGASKIIKRILYTKIVEWPNMRKDKDSILKTSQQTNGNILTRKDNTVTEEVNITGLC